MGLGSVVVDEHESASCAAHFQTSTGRVIVDTTNCVLKKELFGADALGLCVPMTD